MGAEADAESGQEELTSLRARILGAGGWTLGGHFGGYVLRLVGSLVLTRLLVPEMFGIIALAAGIHAVISLLSDIGLRQTIIHSARGDTPAMLNTAWTVQVLRGGVVLLTCAAIGLLLWLARIDRWLPSGSVYAAEELAGVIAIGGLAGAILGFQSTKALAANRNLDLKRLTLIEVLSQIAALVLMIALAWWTRSIWSIVMGGIVAAAVTVWLSHAWLPGKPNWFAWDRESLRELFGYGRWVLFSSILYTLATNADRFFLGGWVSPTTLGLYALAFNLAFLIEGAGARLFSSVAMPAFSQVLRTEPGRFREIYFRMRLPFDLVFVGSAGFLFASGNVIVEFLYDDRYREAGPMLQTLSFGLIVARYGLAGSAYLALGEPQALTWLSFVRLTAIVVIVPLGFYSFGFQGALIGIAFHTAATLPIMFLFNRKHGLNDARFELATLAAWPLGWAAGFLVTSVLH
jgi:O-antigen/teichoic acid export membrane protein